MKVTFIADIPTPYMSTALSALAERVELKVVYGTAEGSRGMNWDTSEAARSLDVTYVGGPILRRRGGKGTDRYLSPRLLRILAQQSPDVILSGAFGPHTLYALAFGARRDVPVVVYSDGWAASEANISAFQRGTRAIVTPRAAGFAANSVVAAARFVELGADPRRVLIAPHTTDMNRWHSVPEKETLTEPDELHLLCTGRLVSWKGFDRAIRAASIARRSVRNLTLTIVGAGQHEGELCELAADLGVGEFVSFEGFVDQAGLPEYFERADVYLFPTLSDPFGIALLESAAAGLPHIASPVAGATFELAIDGVTGLVIDPDDIAALSNGIVRLARDPELRLQMGRAARASTAHRTPAYAAEMYERAARDAVGRGS